MKAFFRGRFAFPILLGTLLCVEAATSSEPLDTWHFRNPLPTGNTPNNVRFLNGLFIVTASSGEVLSSFDGSTWIRRAVLPDTSLNAIEYGNGLYVLTGNGPTGPVLFTSADLENWQVQASAGTNALVSVAYGNGLFVAVGGQTIARSNDGTNWTAVSSPSLRSVVFGNGIFVAEGPAGAHVSADGTSWSPGYDVGFPVSVLRFLNGRFFAGGSVPGGGGMPSAAAISSSIDGTNWTRTIVSWFNTLTEIIFGNGLYLAWAPGLSLKLISTNGTTFTHYFDPSGSSGGKGAFGNGVFVTVGVSFSGAPPFSTQRSNDGTNWVSVTTSPVPAFFADMAHGNGLHVSVGSLYATPPVGTAPAAALAVSASGLSFNGQTASANGPLTGIHFADGLFHVVGSFGTILRSTNGTVWLKRTSGVSGHLRSVTYGDQLWIAVGDNGAVTTSPNGQAWTLRFSGTSSALNGVAFGGGTFVAVGALGTIITSPDGFNWTVQFTDTQENLSDVAYHRGQFVVVGAGGSILTSTDSIIWEAQTSGVSHDLHAITAGEGHFLAAGFRSYDSINKTNVLLSSTNAVDWIPRKPSTSLALYGARYINGTFFVLGANGAILQSAPLNPIQLAGTWNRSLGQFEVTITGKPGQSFRLQSCDSFGNGMWFDRSTFSNTTGSVTFVDNTPVTSSGRLYRVVRD